MWLRYLLALVLLLRLELAFRFVTVCTRRDRKNLKLIAVLMWIEVRNYRVKRVGHWYVRVPSSCIPA